MLLSSTQGSIKRHSALCTFISFCLKLVTGTKKKSFVQAYFMFFTDFVNDIIFGIDQELIEGFDNPIHFPGADWMALVGLTQTGMLNIAVGTEESQNGTPSDASVWEIIDLDIELQQNNWYFMRETTDFRSR